MIKLGVQTVYGCLLVHLPSLSSFTVGGMHDLVCTLVCPRVRTSLVLLAPDRRWVMCEGSRSLADYGVVPGSRIYAYWHPLTGGRA